MFTFWSKKARIPQNTNSLDVAYASRLGRAILSCRENAEAATAIVYTNGALAEATDVALLAVAPERRGERLASDLLDKRTVQHSEIDSFGQALANAGSAEDIERALIALYGEIPALAPEIDDRYGRHVVAEWALGEAKVDGRDRTASDGGVILQLFLSMESLPVSRKAVSAFGPTVYAIAAACEFADKDERAEVAQRLRGAAAIVKEKREYTWEFGPEVFFDEIAIALADARAVRAAHLLEGLAHLVAAYASDEERFTAHTTLVEVAKDFENGTYVAVEYADMMDDVTSAIIPSATIPATGPMTGQMASELKGKA